MVRKAWGTETVASAVDDWPSRAIELSKNNASVVKRAGDKVQGNTGDSPNHKMSREHRSLDQASQQPS
jgi:hypothetical protein